MANISEQQLLAALREATTNSLNAAGLVQSIDNASIIRKLFPPGVFDTSGDGSNWGFKITNSGMELFVSLTGTPTQGNFSEAVVDGYYVKVDDSYSLPFFILADGDPDNPRIDCVYIKRPNRIAVSQGTPAATPVPADIPDGALKIAEILVPAGETDGSGITITDKRVFIGQIVTQADLDGKADKTIPASDGNLAALDGTTGNLKDSGIQPHTHNNKTILDAITDAGSGQIITETERTALGNKADKVANAVAGNLASLDVSGNLVDSGIEAIDWRSRLHFHVDWQTDATWTHASTGSASYSLGLLKCLLATGTTSGSKEELYTGIIPNYNLHASGQQLFLRLQRYGTTFVSTTVYAGLWDWSLTPPLDDTMAHIGWKIIDGAIWASVGDGTAATQVDTGISFDTDWRIRDLAIKYNGTGVEFYISGVLKTTITTNIPAFTNGQLYFSITNGTAEDQKIAVEHIFGVL